MKRVTIALLASALAVVALGLVAGMSGPKAAEKEAVERAVLDYCEAFYDMKPELLERSVHPELNKFGFHRLSPDQEYKQVPSSREQLIELAKVWNADGRFGPDAPKKVEVFDVLDKTAAAKLTGAWGVDYIHLAKYDGKWMLVQVLWQSHPASNE